MSSSSEKTASIIDQIKSSDNIVAKARLINYLKNRQLLPIKEIADQLGTNSSYICNVLRILRLDTMVLDSYYSRTISASHLMVISRLRTKDSQARLFEKVLSEGLTVGQTDAAVREILYGIETDGKRVEGDVFRKIQETLAQVHGDLEVSVVQTRIRAKVEVSIRGSLKKTTAVLKALEQFLSTRRNKDSR